jgi:hypothetical protein
MRWLISGLMGIWRGLPYISALRFNEIGTQVPHEVWPTLDRRAAKPRFSYHFSLFGSPVQREGV